MMAKTSMEVVMSEDLAQRLRRGAESRHKTVQDFVQEALYTYVEDMEDGAMSDVALTEEGLTYYLPEGDAPRAVDHRVFETGRKIA